MRKKNLNHGVPALKKSGSQLWLRIPGLKFEPEKFSEFLQQLKAKKPISKKLSKGQNYGWALTSTKFSNSYGVEDIPATDSYGFWDLIYPTANCFGYAREVLLSLSLAGFYVSRARILALGPGAEMPFHSDVYDLFGRVHVPIETNRAALFQWKVSGKIRENHFAADGGAYLMNVVEPHRVINTSRDQTRYHFVCSVLPRPAEMSTSAHAPDENRQPGLHRAR